MPDTPRSARSAHHDPPLRRPPRTPPDTPAQTGTPEEGIDRIFILYAGPGKITNRLAECGPETAKHETGRDGAEFLDHARG